MLPEWWCVVFVHFCLFSWILVLCLSDFCSGFVVFRWWIIEVSWQLFDILILIFMIFTLPQLIINPTVSLLQYVNLLKLFSLSMIIHPDYTESQKNKQNYFCHNYVKFPPNLTIFGTKMANCLKLYEVHSFSTSPNSRQCTTMLNADVPDC